MTLAPTGLRHSHISFCAKKFVMRGLDPRIHAVVLATNRGYGYWRSRVDGRIKSGHDDFGWKA
jgi:hypothetical protein